MFDLNLRIKDILAISLQVPCNWFEKGADYRKSGLFKSLAWRAKLEKKKSEIKRTWRVGALWKGRWEERTCPARKRREKGSHPDVTNTNLVRLDGLTVQWATNWHVSRLHVNGEETFGILVGTGARQSENVVSGLLCWNHLQGVEE